MSTPKLITVTWRLKRSYMEFIKILVKIVLRWGVRSAWRIVTFIWKEVTIATLTFRNLKRKTLVPEHPYNIKSRVVKLNRFFWLQILVPVAWGLALWGTASSRGFRTATQSSGRIRTWTGSSSSSRRRKGSPKKGSMRAQSWNSQTGSPSSYTYSGPNAGSVVWVLLPTLTTWVRFPGEFQSHFLFNGNWAGSYIWVMALRFCSLWWRKCLWKLRKISSFYLAGNRLDCDKIMIHMV